MTDCVEDSDQLKACPFCASPAEYDTTEDGGHFVACTDCMACSSVIYPLMDDVKNLLIERWNRRVTK